MPSADPRGAPSNGTVPKRVWTLWTQGLDQMPPVPRACLDSWRELNPGWAITALTRESLCEWADPVLRQSKAWSLPPQKLSNLARLSLLASHGGVWVDATCYCMKPLDEWLGDVVDSGFFAFEGPGRDRLISSWFLACPPGSYIARRMWNSLSSYYLDRNLSDDGWRRYVRRSLQIGINLDIRTTSLWFLPPLPQLGITPYHSFHYMFNRLTWADPDFGRIWDQTARLSADGPHGLLSHGLDRPPSAQIIDEIQQRRVPLYKLDWRIDPAALPSSSTLIALLGSRRSSQ